MIELAKRFFNLIEKTTKQEGLTRYEGNRAFLQNSKKYPHAPNYFASDMLDLGNALKEYLDVVNTTDIAFTNSYNIENVYNDFF